MEHEVAKLIGAPPGYLGHRETQPLLTQQKLNAVTSERSNLSLILFDEIEKAAPSMARLLLGVLDKAALRLGDNTHVNFERSLIFMTSNLGAREMASFLKPSFGFGVAVAKPDDEVAGKLHSIGMNAVRRRFAPEFVNRVDAVITYQPLSRETLDGILEIQLAEIQKHIHRRLGAKAFSLELTRSARRFLLEKGTSPESGARELKRTLHRQIVHRLGTMVAQERVPPQSTVRMDLSKDRSELRFRVVNPRGEEEDPPLAA
jgi:ATP-dependent Clp protease ATP-binding subunit ClpA